MSLRVWRHPKADDDLLEIWLFVARDSVRAADRLLDSIEEKCRLLATYPAIGPARDDIGPGIRTVSVGPYIVLYRQREDRVDIVRVVHGARNLSDLG